MKKISFLFLSMLIHWQCFISSNNQFFPTPDFSCTTAGNCCTTVEVILTEDISQIPIAQVEMALFTDEGSWTWDLSREVTRAKTNSHGAAKLQFNQKKITSKGFANYKLIFEPPANFIQVDAAGFRITPRFKLDSTQCDSVVRVQVEVMPKSILQLRVVYSNRSYETVKWYLEQSNASLNRCGQLKNPQDTIFNLDIAGDRSYVLKTEFIKGQNVVTLKDSFLIPIHLNHAYTIEVR